MTYPEDKMDDDSVDYFARIMKAKLARKRDDGRGGWWKKECRSEYLSALLREHVEKGDPVDVAILAMMIYMKGDVIE